MNSSDLIVTGTVLDGIRMRPQVDVVEVPQHDAVDHQDLARDLEFVAQNGTERLRDIPIEHDVKRLSGSDAIGQRAANAVGEGEQALVRRRAAPAECQCNLAIAIDVECPQMVVDRLGEREGIDVLVKNEGRLDDLQIPPRQQFAGGRYVSWCCR